MSRSRSTLASLAPWLGTIAAIVGWGVSHQLGSDSVFDDCSTGDGAFVLLVCAPALLLTIAGGVFSFGVWSAGGEGEGRRFVGLVSGLLAALAAFTIVLQIAAGLILPGCAA
jgi:hypothetical protein